MKIQSFFICLIALLMLGVMAGCGISQQEYDLIASELDTARQQLQTTNATAQTFQAKCQELTTSLQQSQTTVNATQTKVSELTANLEKIQVSLKDTQTELGDAQTQLTTLQAEQSSFKADLMTAWDRFDRIAALEALLVRYWSAATKNDTATLTEVNTRMGSYVEPIGDLQLSTLWQQTYDAYKNKQETAYIQSLAGVMDRNNYLFGQQATVIRDILE